MRIVYLSDFRPFPRLTRSEEFVAGALEELGHEVVRFQAPPYRQRGRLSELDPDVLIVGHARDMPRRWIPALARENPRALVVQWIFDHLRLPGREKRWFLPRARAWDLSFLKDRARFAFYERQGIRCHWLHEGAPAGFAFATEREPEHECDIAFLGSPHHPFRIQILQRLAAEGFRVHVYSHRAYFKAWRGAGMRHVFENRHNADMAPICASAKFVLAVGCFPDEWEGYWSDRLYMTLASGGLALTHYVRGMEEHFENRRHLLWWRDQEQCLARIREYGPQIEERERIRRAGWEHVHAQHTYHDRCRQFVAVCEAALARKRAMPAAQKKPASWRLALPAWARGRRSG